MACFRLWLSTGRNPHWIGCWSAALDEDRIRSGLMWFRGRLWNRRQNGDEWEVLVLVGIRPETCDCGTKPMINWRDGEWMQDTCRDACQGALTMKSFRMESASATSVAASELTLNGWHPPAQLAFIKQPSESNQNQLETSTRLRKWSEPHRSLAVALPQPCWSLVGAGWNQLICFLVVVVKNF